MFRYIGNKIKLVDAIISKIIMTIGYSGTVADIMAGTGTVSLELKRNGFRVIASDIMTYSKHHLVTQLLYNQPPSFSKLVENYKDKFDNYETIIQYLNDSPEKKGYFYNEFSPDGTPANNFKSRMYFTSNNASKIDSIREAIETWKNENLISPNEESVLKHTLIMAVNRVANISGTYGYYLSSF